MAAAAGLTNNRLFFIRDRLSGLFFLVDTGAGVSVYPATNLEMRSGCIVPTLRAVKGSSIRTFGTRAIPFCIKSQRFEWNYILADIAQSLLGAHFFCHFGL